MSGRVRIAVALVGVTSMAAACAPAPTTISAEAVSTAQVSHLDCPALAQLVRDNQASLAQLSAQQARRSVADAGSFLLIGVTPTLVDGGGNKASIIARQRGEIDAARAAAIQKQCAEMPPKTADEDRAGPQRTANEAAGG